MRFEIGEGDQGRPVGQLAEGRTQELRPHFALPVVWSDQEQIGVETGE